MIPNPQKLSVLVVDDEVLNLKLLSAALATGYDVLTTMTGRDALTMLAQLAHADQLDNLLVLLDVMMPEMDGFSVLSEIQENYPGLPVMMCTAVNRHQDVVRAFNLGAIDYILKPFQLQTVRDKIEKAAAKTLSQRALR